MRHLNLDTMTLTVYGKGNKVRHVPISDRAWLELLPRVIEVWGTEDPLVPCHERNARAAITRAGTRVGIDLASHDMRMTFGTEAFRKSNIRVTQRLLGHSSVETTQLYTGVTEEEERAAVDFTDEEDE
jgi:integrase/recombinase XerD